MGSYAAYSLEAVIRQESRRLGVAYPDVNFTQLERRIWGGRFLLI